MSIVGYIMVFLAVSVALISGLLFSFSIAVSPGLKGVSDPVFVEVMQHINRRIQNGVFFLCFFGPVVLFPVVLYLGGGLSAGNGQLVVSAVCYAMAVGITAVVHVPLNNQLDSVDMARASLSDLGEMRTRFESRWVFWNHIRTVFSTISLILVVWSLSKMG